MMNLILSQNELRWGNHNLPCKWGYGGIQIKNAEGDGVTPTGIFPFRRVFYRADRQSKPKTVLPLQAITPQDGWCDDINDGRYNQHIYLPYNCRYEKLWREDNVYDLILVVGYNDDPIIRGQGSAIFVHIMNEEKISTEGCVALYSQDLLRIIQECTQNSSLVVSAKDLT